LLKRYVSFNFLTTPIPQFDILTIGAQVFGLLLTLMLFYYYTVKITLPSYIEIKKFRTKKLLKNSQTVNLIDGDLNQHVWLINYCYKHFLK
jgi:hypothetical protein